MDNNAWAVVHEKGFIMTCTVKWFRRDSIAAYVALYQPSSVPDWAQRTTAWRWRWLKRRHRCEVRRIEMNVIGE